MASSYFDYWLDIPDEFMVPESADEPSLAPRDPKVPSTQPESADWLNDLHVEIGWMRDNLSAEIEQGYRRVCKLLSEMPESATLKKEESFLNKEKSFLKFAKYFLTQARDDKIKWDREQCFDIVRRIKSYVLHLRGIKGAERSGKQLWRPVCHDERPGLQQQMNRSFFVSLRLADETALPASIEHLRAWKRLRLAENHYLIFEEFESLKGEFSHIVTLAYRTYRRLAHENEKKYLPLARKFELCVKFFRYSREDLLLISKDEFDYYARKIRTLVTGVDSTESWYLNGSSSTYASQPESRNRRAMFGVDAVDWKEDMYKEIELAKKTELPHLMELYEEVCTKCQNPASDAERKELKEQKKSLKLAMELLDLTREDEIEWSWNECHYVMMLVKLYAIRYRNEYLAEQSEEQQQLEVVVCTDHGDQSLVHASASVDSSLIRQSLRLADEAGTEISRASNDPSLLASRKRKRTAAAESSVNQYEEEACMLC